MVRILSVVLAVVLGGNGVAMLLAPLWWYGVMPGVTATGPFNPHFVRDIGAAYLVCGVVLVAFAWRPRASWPALAAAAGFLMLHAAIHVFDAACGSTPLKDALRDLPGIYLLAAVVLALALGVARPARQA